jgi:hypothetical protein
MNLLLASNAGAQEYRVKGGTQQISENLLKEIGEENVLFEHPVLTINQVKMTFQCFQTLKRIRMFHSKKTSKDTNSPHPLIFFFPPTQQTRGILFQFVLTKEEEFLDIKNNFFYLFFFHRNQTRLRLCAPTAAVSPATGSS